MRDIAPQIAAKHARLVVVGNGSVAQARGLKDELSFPGEIWVDQAMVAYAAAGLRRGARHMFSLAMFGNIWRALRAGHRQQGVQGDPWQLGGAFVIAPDGRIHWRHLSATAGDHPAVESYLSVLP